MAKTSVSMFVLFLVAVLAPSTIRCLTVDRVYFGSETPFAGPIPVWVMCDVTPELDEEVQHVTYHHDGELVYEWINNVSMTAYGVLEDRVYIPYYNYTAWYWNIKIIRLSNEMQGNFTCTATSDQNSTDFNSFTFLTFYAPEYSNTTLVDEDHCRANATLTCPAVYPCPISLCYMIHEETDFQLRLPIGEQRLENSDGSCNYRADISVQFAEYPEGSYMRCHDYIYGDEMELLRWTPEEKLSCHPHTIQNPAFSVEDNSLPACRFPDDRIKAGSSKTYVCNVNPNARVETVCNGFTGNWTVDLWIDENWPPCSAPTILSTVLLLISAVFVSIIL